MTDEEIQKFERERLQRERREYLERMGWKPKYKDYSFATARIVEGNRNTYKACKAFVDQPSNLYIYGNAGNGRNSYFNRLLSEGCNFFIHNVTAKNNRKHVASLGNVY